MLVKQVKIPHKYLGEVARRDNPHSWFFTLKLFMSNSERGDFIFCDSLVGDNREGESS